VILPDFSWRIQKTININFWTLFAENFMIFQTAVRKYVGVYKKVEVFFYPQISIKKIRKNFGRKMRKIIMS
jgi:hypothetical protein